VQEMYDCGSGILGGPWTWGVIEVVWFSIRGLVMTHESVRHGLGSVG
jgi:hypothetical protein